jgi:hypothetical protein
MPISSRTGAGSAYFPPGRPQTYQFAEEDRPSASWLFAYCDQGKWNEQAGTCPYPVLYTENIYKKV